ncbi:hypothetical protein DL766_000033 [Monosporascus sp. MC13-8B]|uniref:AB hydrolase-1 domain-containing protein n=1 Tax=Monosporascus cannonballus TaxID=155416 RepID=A0ABY0HJV3_9PEZI|nr:hypothetical protein DL762_000402 [Monosporascus cannonballus]RYP01194.1 hypothetical protein DL763_000319 [Monosporascus cannonballus]RYP40232.1 hypothetical protein DL766_000033 [Monosporascus sp. MC13-8B]
MVPAVTCTSGPGEMVYGFETIRPSPTLEWTPCFEAFTCAKLEVPLDYADPSIGSTGIAFIKLAGRNAAEDAENILIIHGRRYTHSSKTEPHRMQIFGEQYNIVAFDPRGVNNSGPALDCFPGSAEARDAFSRVYKTGATNTSSTSLETQDYSSHIYGEWCNNAVREKFTHGYYVTTAEVARDILTYVEAEAKSAGNVASDAKLWAYGINYGTVVGSTFASLFPERWAEWYGSPPAVLDGVLDAEDYYANGWRQNIGQADEAVASFAAFCHQAGPENCTFWGPSPEDITRRLDRIVSRLEREPIPVPGIETGGLPALATHSDLKAAILNALYSPLGEFPALADVLTGLENGNATGIANYFASSYYVRRDTNAVIRCSDSYGRNSLVTIDDYREYAEHVAAQSRYVGDIWPNYVDSVVCRSFEPDLPDSMIFQGKVFPHLTLMRYYGYEITLPFPLLLALAVS